MDRVKNFHFEGFREDPAKYYINLLEPLPHKGYS